MRLPSTLSLLRTVYTLSSASTLASARQSPQALLAGTSQTLRSSQIHQTATYMPNFLSSLFSSSADSRSMVQHPVQKSESEWETQLSPEQFRVLRKQATEAPFQGKYDKHYPNKGTYTCAGCDAPLYTAEHKFKSGCGWPAFYDAIPGAITRHEDVTMGMVRTEIVCSSCGGHLGHVFKGERFGNPIDERHCVNSVSLNFGADDAAAKGGQQEKSGRKI